MPILLTGEYVTLLKKKKKKPLPFMDLEEKFGKKSDKSAVMLGRRKADVARAAALGLK